MDLIQNSLEQASRLLAEFIAEDGNIEKIRTAAHGKAGDVLLAISTSGNSVNILKATDEARRKGMKIVGLTGKDGGEMRNKCDVCIVVPWHEYSDRIQEIHIKIIHILIEYIEKQLLSTDTK